MADLNFPSSPTDGQTYTVNNVYYTYSTTTGAWMTSLVSNPFNNSVDTQILFNDSNIASGNSGMVFDKSSNTARFKNIVSLGNTDVSGNLVVSGNISVTNNLVVSGNISVTKNVAVTGAVNVAQDVVVFGSLGVDKLPTYPLDVNGTAAANLYISTSDVNQKKNIKLIVNSLEKVKQLNGVTFEWISDSSPSAGVIAQDVEKVLPEIVHTDKLYKSVNHNGLIGLIVEAVKEQQKQIDELKRIIGEIK